VKKNNELHKVGVCLLPEWLLASPKEVVDKGGDSIGECVGIKSVVQGVVAEIGIETDFDVISLASEAAWGKGLSAHRNIREQEHRLETAVSRYIGEMPILWLAVEDPASRQSRRH
jgi:hypothetical protein